MHRQRPVRKRAETRDREGLDLEAKRIRRRRDRERDAGPDDACVDHGGAGAGFFGQFEKRRPGAGADIIEAFSARRAVSGKRVARSQNGDALKAPRLRIVYQTD